MSDSLNRSRQSSTPGAGKRNHVTNRLVVCFRSEGATRLAHSAHKLLSDQSGSAELGAYQSLVRLNKECRLKSLRGLFFDRLGVDEADARSVQDRFVERIRARYPARSRRAPGAPLPDLTNYYVLEFEEGGDIEEHRRRYRADQFVASVDFDIFVRHQYTPNDPYFHSSGSWGQVGDDLWGLKKLQMEQAWDLSQGEGIVVAVVDTGIDYNHPDIAANIWTNPGEIPGNGIDDDENGYVDDVRGWNFADNNNDPMDTDDLEGHGTHVAGIIAAVGDNGQGIIGVAPRAKVMALKHAGKTETTASSATSMALLYAAANGADVINNSWNATENNSAIAEAIRFAHALGIVVVFATGNAPLGQAEDVIAQPGLLTLRETIKVGATLPDDSPAPFSDWGKFVDVAAPGGGSTSPLPAPEIAPRNSILSLRSSSIPQATSLRDEFVGDAYLRMWGTSAATPHVSGLAALMLARRPELTNEDVRQILRASADHAGGPGFDFRTGYGRINAPRALQFESPARVRILEPVDSLLLGPDTRTVRVCGRVSGPLLRNFQVFYSRFDDLSSRQPLSDPVSCAAEGLMACWDVCDLPIGDYLLRLVATNRDGTAFEDTVQIARENPGIVHLTNDSAGRYSPHVHLAGKWVVWVQTDTPTSDPRMVLLDLDTKSTQTVAQFKVVPVVSALSEDYLVYDVSDDSGATLRLHDLRSGKEKSIAVSPSSVDFPFGNVAISGNMVVWQQWAPDGSSSVFGQDVSTGETKTLSNDPISAVAIDGNRLVLSDNIDITITDLATGSSQTIPEDDPTASRTSPVIAGDNILWIESPASAPRNNIRHYNVVTGKTRSLKEDLHLVRDLHIWGNRAVWADVRNAKYDIYLYDLDADQETVITASFDQHTLPGISGNRVVWLTDTGTQANVDLFELPNPSPAARAPRPVGEVL